MIMGAIAAGLSLSVVGEISRAAGRLVLPFLLVMLTLLFLQIPLRDLTAAFRQKTAAGLNISVNFVWNPVFAWLLGWLFLYDHPELRTGLLLLMVTPCTDWYLIFTGMAQGNIALSTSLLPWNLVLQLTLLPVYLLLLAGTVIPVDLLLLLESILLVLLLPLGLAALIRGAVIRGKGEAWLRSTLIPRVNPFQMIFLALAIAAMFVSEGKVLLQHIDALWLILIPVVLFFLINFWLITGISRTAGLSYPDYASLCCTTIARNSPVALTIAIAAFPGQPLIALALIIGPLVELPLLWITSRALLKMKEGEGFS